MTPPSDNVSSISDRARSRSGTAADPQEALFDRVIEDDALVAALEEREQVREQRRDVNASFKTADTEAKDLLLNYHLEVGEVARVGRFRIKKTAVAPNSVAFDTAGGERLSIGTIDDES